MVKILNELEEFQHRYHAIFASTNMVGKLETHFYGSAYVSLTFCYSSEQILTRSSETKQLF